MPAAALSRWSWGGCVVYAEAMSRLTGLPAAVMEPTCMEQWAEIGSGNGIHGVVVHPDGDVEDVWGKFPPMRVARRYGMAEWRLSEARHRALVDEALAVRDTAAADIEEAVRAIGASGRAC